VQKIGALLLMNILVICSDTFRYDHLGFIKKHNVLTPNLDKLAAESIFFNDYWLCSFPTVLNRIEVFTGRSAFPIFNWAALPQEYPVLSEVFTHHGFDTALISDNFHVVHEGLGFERGFDHVQAVLAQANDGHLPSWSPREPLPDCPPDKLGVRPHNIARYQRNLHWYRQQRTSSTAAVFQRAMEWLAWREGQYFLWIGCFDPHEPWDAPSDHIHKYPWDPDGDTVFWPKQGYSNMYSPSDMNNIRSLYKAEISEVDAWVGHLMDFLQRRNLLEDTAILFCSDHGYYLGEHNLVGKLCAQGTKRPNAIYEELGHIPLLLRHPQGVGAGRTVSGLVQPQDIFPSVLDLAGIPQVSWTQGHSVIPWMLNGTSPSKLAVCGAAPHRKTGSSCLTAQADGWYLVYSPVKGLPGSELYHQATDPTHTRNVISSHPDIAANLFQALSTWLDEMGTPASRKQQLMHNTPTTTRIKFDYARMLRQKREFYLRNYRDYASKAECAA
jgi:arylsulfatase A-like enzyme